MGAGILPWVFFTGQVAVTLSFLIIFSYLQNKLKKEKSCPVVKNESLGSEDVKLESKEGKSKQKIDKTPGNEELEALKKENIALSDKLKNLDTHLNSELEHFKKENSELKNKLAGKDSELEGLVSQRSVLGDELKKQEEEFAALKKENLEVAVKLKESEENIVKLKKELEAQNSVLAESKNKEKTPLKLLEDEIKKAHKHPEGLSERKKKKIGEILLENNFITKEILDKALKYQEECGTSITQYLIGYGYINEHQLAQCICTQFNIPYLPLSSYNIRSDIIELIPVDIAEKYWLVPVEKTRDTLMVVMADPWDAEAIKEVEEISGFSVQPFVGILSEIVEALENYYKVVIKEKGKKSKNTAPFFISSETYKGPERRRTVRFAAKIDVAFPLEGFYKKSVTKDISREGVFFEAEKALPLASLLSFQIDLPKDFYPLPITALIQVVRVMDLENGKFGIGAKILKIAKQEIDAVISYASKYKEK